MNAFITNRDAVTASYAKPIADLAIKHRLPSMNEDSPYVEAGGLMSYAANDADQFRRAAYYVDRILKGTKPTDLPIEQPTKFEFVINLKTAKQIRCDDSPVGAVSSGSSHKIAWSEGHGARSGERWGSMRKKFFGLTLSALLFALSSVALLLVLCVSAEAQQPKTRFRIGYLTNDAEIRKEYEGIFRQALRELGYIEGQNLVIEWRFTKGKLELLPNLADELVRLKLDVIVTSGTQPIRALKKATTTIPIVVTGGGDLVGRGLVESLARPGGNITG